MKERIAIVSGSFAEFVNFAKENNLTLTLRGLCASNEIQEFFDCRKWEHYAGNEFHSMKIVGTDYLNTEVRSRLRTKIRLVKSL
jgi:hypothetical protein